MTRAERYPTAALARGLHDRYGRFERRRHYLLTRKRSLEVAAVAEELINFNMFVGENFHADAERRRRGAELSPCEIRQVEFGFGASEEERLAAVKPRDDLAREVVERYQPAAVLVAREGGFKHLVEHLIDADIHAEGAAHGGEKPRPCVYLT